MSRDTCGYCVAAHTALAKRAGLTEQQTKDARRATSGDEKEQAALVFARKVVQVRGIVADADVDMLRRAGYTEGEIGEIVANVALSIFTNYFNHVAATGVDFPAAPSLEA
jgi:alkylhydroperoxidase family enzyme